MHLASYSRWPRNEHRPGATAKTTFPTLRPVPRRPSTWSRHSRQLHGMHLNRKRRWSCTMNFLNPSNWTRTTGPKPQQKAAVAEWAVSRAQSPSQTQNTLRPSNTNPPLLSQTKHKVIFHIQLPKETPPNTLTPPHTDLLQADRLQQPRNVMAPSGFAHPLYQPSCGRKMGQL